MSISSINSALLSSLQTSTTNSSSSIGSELLAALDPSSQSANASDPLLSTIVSLGSSASDPSAATYNAQGLLSMMQSSSFGDPLLQGGSSSTGSGDVESAVLQAALAQADGTAASGSSSSTANSGFTAASTSTDLTSNLVQALKQDPAMATLMVQNQMNQSLVDLMG